MQWKKKENKFLWSKESDKKSALYTNLCTIRQRDIIQLDIQQKSDCVSREFCKRADTERKTTRWSNALSFYSKSLCFAETYEQMSHCFACRAICFYELCLFNECLGDIKLAKQYNYKNVEEMDKCIEECEKMIDMGRQNEPFVPKLSFPSQEKYVGFANVLRINRNAEFGVHIVATDDIAAGETVLVEPAFTALAVGNEQRCSKCFTTCTNLVPCPKCTRALFCAGKCENCDIHRLECGIQLPKINSLIREDFFPVIRSIIKALNIFENVGDLKEFVESVISGDQMELPTDTLEDRSKYSIYLRHFDKNHPDSSNTTKSNIQSIYQALMGHRPIANKFTTKHHQRFLMHLIGHHISVRRSIANGVEFRTKLVIPVIGGYFNHSCIPNAIMLPIDGKVVVSTSRPIKAGEQVCISYYGSKFQYTVIERQKLITSQFHFKCKCERCAMEVTDSLQPHEFLDEKTRESLESCTDTLFYSPDKRRLVTELCVKLLNEHGRSTWCEDLSILLTNYYVLLHSKYLLKSQY